MAKLGKCLFCQEQKDEYMDCKEYARPEGGGKIAQRNRFTICLTCWKAFLTAAVVLNERQTAGPVPGPAAIPGPGKLWVPASVDTP